MRWQTRTLVPVCLIGFLAIATQAVSDEGGISFWLPGTYGSLAAVPQQPGWNFATVYYHTDVSAGGQVAASREIQIGKLSPSVNVDLNLKLKARADLAFLNTGYVFETPVLGGQLALSALSIVGRNNVGLDGTLTAAVGPVVITRQGSIDSSITGFGDIYPKAEIRWNAGLNNYMTYITGNIPVGAYSSARLANLGIGHGAVDSGGGYTYFDPAKGREFSVVGGLTYNFKNSDTAYRNGIDAHIDWAASQFLSKQFHIGAVGYFYQQLTADSGAAPILGDFKSRVAGIGPQAGFIFPVGGMQGYLNMKTYWEFGANNRPEGWNAWITLVITPAPASTMPSSASIPNR